MKTWSRSALGALAALAVAIAAAQKQPPSHDTRAADRTAYNAQIEAVSPPYPASLDVVADREFVTDPFAGAHDEKSETNDLRNWPRPR